MSIIFFDRIYVFGFAEVIFSNHNIVFTGAVNPLPFAELLKFRNLLRI